MSKSRSIKSTNLDKNIYMPIDQYGRYGIVADQIKKFIKIKKQKCVKILDIGGYKGEIHRFFTDAEASITVIDLYESSDKNYVKGSALDLPFDDSSFDYVVSFEVFEHIPREDRNRFISEAIRVSRGPFILTAPFSGLNDEVLQSEIYVNELWKIMHGYNHKWLYEHIDFRTPSQHELEEILHDQKLKYISLGNNDLLLWNLMVSFNYLTTLYRGSGLNPEVHKFYNENAEYFDADSEAYYRYIYIIGNDAIKLSKEYTKSARKVTPIEKRERTIQLINKVFSTIAKDFKTSLQAKQDEIDTLAKELSLRIKMYDDQQRQMDILNLEIVNLREKSSKKLIKKATNLMRSSKIKIRKKEF